MKRRKLIFILSSALLLVLTGFIVFGFLYLGWGFGPQLTDIEVGMTAEEVDRWIEEYRAKQQDRFPTTMTLCIL